MWSQIERFVRRAAKRADGIGDFLKSLKPLMGCGAINPHWSRSGNPAMNAVQFEDGSIFVHGGDDEPRDFMLSITEASPERQQQIVNILYDQTQRIILLVRDRLEREKPFDPKITEVTED